MPDREALAEVPFPDYMTLPETAKFTRTPEPTLYQWRLKNYGPPARKVGRKLLYKRSEVIAWLDAQVGRSA